MKKSRWLPFVILFTVAVGAARAEDAFPEGSRQYVAHDASASATVRTDARSEARGVKHGIKTTAKQAKYDIKHGVKNGAREVKQGVKDAFR